MRQRDKDAQVARNVRWLKEGLERKLAEDLVKNVDTGGHWNNVTQRTVGAYVEVRNMLASCGEGTKAPEIK